MKRMLVLILTLTMVLTLAACGGGKSAEPPVNSGTQTEAPAPETGGDSEAGEDIEGLEPEPGATLLVWESKEERPFVEEIAKQFTEKYGIPVKMDEVGAGDQVTKLTNDGPAGLGADVVLFPHDNLGKAVAAGLVLPNDVLKKKRAAPTRKLRFKALPMTEFCTDILVPLRPMRCSTTKT